MLEPSALCWGRSARCWAQVDQGLVLAAVQELIGCLVAPAPGLDCGLAAQLVSRTGPAHAAKYVGVLPTLAADPQDPAGVADLPRFAWNYLAGALHAGPAALANGGLPAAVHRGCAGAACPGLPRGRWAYSL